MARHPLPLPLAVGILALSAMSPAQAQTIGTLQWQLHPYCNRLVLTVVQQGALFLLNGYDDQCGAQPGTAVGVASMQPAGTVALNVHVVVAGLEDLHVQAVINPAMNYSGTWTDSGGAGGQFQLGWNTGGSARPIPALPQMRVLGSCSAGWSIRAINVDGSVVCETGTGGDITAVAAGTGLTGGGTTGAVTLAVDSAVTQSRVTGTCAVGSSIRVVNANGTVTCQADTNAGGDITGVTAGAGLTGGAASGVATLAVSFAGSGAAQAVARSDHNHTLSTGANTAVGSLALGSIATGVDNTAAGVSALGDNTYGSTTPPSAAMLLAGTRRATTTPPSAVTAS
jgi:hypothetical protein